MMLEIKMKNKKTHILLMLIATSTFNNSYTFLSRADREFMLFHDNLISQTFDTQTNPQLVRSEKLEISSSESGKRLPKKNWTFIVYMAANNDLRAFGVNNLKQMANQGSNEHVNIVVHLDIQLNGTQNSTRRYYVEKNKIHQVNSDNFQAMDSGDPKTLISCCQWAINNYPAHNYALIFWNHGTGIIDPSNFKLFSPNDLFTLNPLMNKYEVNREINFLDIFNFMSLDDRGVCWDNSSGNYLTNQKIEYALSEICKTVLNGKFSIIGFDACLMSMIEVAHLLKPFAHILVGSQEVELGAGWNYSHVLEPLTKGPITANEFAAHIVHAYGVAYQAITSDYTQSALNLQYLPQLELNVHVVAGLLIRCLEVQSKNSVKMAIFESKSKKACTHFDEPSYIDLFHFYSNLIENIGKFKLKHNTYIIDKLKKELIQGKRLIQQVVIANTAGKNLSRATGISIYFPERQIHQSYVKTKFSIENNWYKLIDSMKH